MASTHPTRHELRLCALGASVVHDLDLKVVDRGVVLEEPTRVLVTWRELRDYIRPLDPASEVARDRLAHALRCRRWVHDRTYAALALAVRPVALPPGHHEHPGAGWSREQVLGDALDLGLGFLGVLPEAPDAVIVIHPQVLAAEGVNLSPLWKRARLYLESMGQMAAMRHQREREPIVRPMGDCDVLTLLASRSFRRVIADEAGGMRPVAVPMRVRGWLDLSRIDPAFTPAAWAATDGAEQGLPRPVLVTAEEVTMAAVGGRPQIALEDPAAKDASWLRPALYR